MKRNFFKTIAALFTVATMIFAVSCDKNEDDNDGGQNQNNNNNTTLVGTNWINHQEGEDELDGGVMAHYVSDVRLSFGTATTGNVQFSMEYPEYPEENMNYGLPFTYTYQAPNGTITASAMGYTMNMTFVVNGNQMTVTTTTDGETESAIFTRQQ
jgi:nitrate reductase beta subunit